MKFRQAAGAIGVAMVSVGTLVVVSVPAGAATGANPNGSFCKLEKTSQRLTSSKTEAAATKAMIAGNWKVAQKDLIAIDNQNGSLTNQFNAALSGAPANVKAAAKQLIKLEPGILNAVKTSSTAAIFEKTELALTNSKAFSSAATIIAGYDTSQCGAPAIGSVG